MQRLLKALLLLVVFTIGGLTAYAQPVAQISGRIPQGTLRVFVKDTLYQITGYYVVAGQLIIEPGTTVEFLPNGRLIDTVGGKIIADGDMDAIWNGDRNAVNAYADRYCDLGYLTANVSSTGKPEITAPGPNWLDYVPRVLFYYANRLDRCATDPNRKNVPYVRNVLRAPIVFRGRPINQFSKEWGHIVVLPGADSAIFRNCQFVNFRKDTSVVQSTQFYNPTSAAGYNQAQINAGFALNDTMRRLTSGGGGAMTVFSSKTWILDCRFDSNLARYHGGAVQFLQAPYDPTGQFYRPAPGVALSPNAYPPVSPESYDLYGGVVTTPLGPVPGFTATTPSSGPTQYRQTYDDGRMAINMGRVRRLYFRDNRVVLSNVVNDVNGYRDTTDVAPQLPTGGVAKNEAYGGAMYVSGRRHITVYFGGGSALERLGLGNDPTDTLVCERNHAVNYQNAGAIGTTLGSARGGALYVGDSTSLVFELSRFVNNFTATPNIAFDDANPANGYRRRSLLSQGGGIYMSSRSPFLTVRDNILFRTNHSGQGGAIYVEAVPVGFAPIDTTLSPSLLGDSVWFIRNTAEYDGGAIYTQRNMMIESRYLTSIDSSAPGFPLIDRRIVLDSNAAGLAGGAIVIDSRSNSTNSTARMRRVLLTNNIVGDSARVSVNHRILLLNPVVSPIRPGFQFGTIAVNDSFRFPTGVGPTGLSNDILGGGAIWAQNSNTNFFQAVEFRNNTALGGNGGAIGMVLPVRANRYFLAEGDSAFDFRTNVASPIPFDAGREPEDQREMTRFLGNLAQVDTAIVNAQAVNQNPAVGRSTLIDPNRNYMGLGGAIYINDRQPPGQNPGAARVDSVIAHRIRIEQNVAYSGSAVYSDNYELRFRLNKSLVAMNMAVSPVGRTQDSILNYQTAPAASNVAAATFFGEIEGPLPTYLYHTDANSIYDNDARFIIRLPDAPAGAVGNGQSGVDTLRGNFWGVVEAPVTTVLPSGTLQSTYYIQGYGCTLPLRDPSKVAEQGPFESPRRPGETRPSYVYTPVPIYVIPDTLLMEGRVYDIYDKGLDIKAVDYSNPRLSPIEDFAVGIPPRLRSYPGGIYAGKVVRRLTRDPFIADVDSTYALLQREYVGNHPIGYPLFLEANANYTFNRDSANDDQWALNHTVFFVINVETGEIIRSNLKQVTEGTSLFRSRVEFVPDSINRDPLARRTREGRAAFSIAELYRLTPQFYLQNYNGPALDTYEDSLQVARFMAARYEDSVTLEGRRYGGVVTPGALELGGNGFRYVNRTNPVNFVNVYAGERYRALPVKTGDRIWVISRTMLWRTDDSLVAVLNDAQATGLQFTIDTVGNSVAAPVILGDKEKLENRQPIELRNSRFLVEDQNYPGKSNTDTSRIFEFIANDVNGFFDPRSILFPDRYTALRYEWTPLVEFPNGTTTPSNDPTQVRLASWLRADTVFPNVTGRLARDSARGYLRFYGQPRNPDVVPGGELLELRVSNYPPGIRTIDSLRALADSLRPADSIIARYAYLYPPYFNCQVYQPDSARFLQQDTIDLGGASTATYRLRLFVQDTPPNFTGEVLGCGRNGVPVANLTNKLRFDYDLNTDDEAEDRAAAAQGWDFRYGRTTYGFVFTSRTPNGQNGDSLATDDVRQIRPVWMADQYLMDSTTTADLGADLLRTGRIKIRIDSTTAINLLRNPAQANNLFNLDSVFTLFVNDGHTGQNNRDKRVLVNVAPQLQPVVLPRAREDFDYNPALLDTTRRITAYDLNYNQRQKFTLIYRNDALNPAEFMTGATQPDSNGTQTNTAQIAFVPRDRCYAEAGLWQAPKTTPSWLKINPYSGILYGTPGLQDAPRTFATGGPDTISVVVEDEYGLTDVRTYILEVDSTNHRPRLFGRPAIKCVEAGKPYDDSICVTDLDLGRLRFTETLNLFVVNPPSGMTVTPSTINGPGEDTVCLRVSGTVPANASGKLRISIAVKDVANQTDTLTYEISVSEQLTWGMPLFVRNTNATDGNATQTLFFGLAPGATTGDEPTTLGRLDTQYCEYELPPLPPTDVFDARWTIVTTQGTLRNIFPTSPSAGQATKQAWKGIFQAGNLPGGSPNYPVVFCWSKEDALKAPYTIWFEDQFWDDSANTGLFRVNMKKGTYQAGTGITVREVGANKDSICVEINLTSVSGFKIVVDYGAGVDDLDVPVVAGGFTLASNVPNPITNSTEISYYAPTRGDLQLEVFDVNGRLVRTLHSGVVEPGQHSVVWTAVDNSNRPVPSGTYTYRLKAGSVVLTRQMQVVR